MSVRSTYSTAGSRRAALIEATIVHKPIHFSRIVQIVGLLALFSVGCQNPHGIEADIKDNSGRLVEKSIIGRSVEHRPIECYTLGNGPDVALILSTIHGDETGGISLVRHLANHLAGHPELLVGRKFILIPIANPDGFAHHSRHNVRGVDLNRNYPAANFHRDKTHGPSALSEPESEALHRLIHENHPRRIVSLHQPLRYGDPCIDYDGPGQELADAMAQRCELPVHRLGGRPGSLGSWAGNKLGVPIITVELPNATSKMSDEQLWARYGEMMLTAALYGSDVLYDRR